MGSLKKKCSERLYESEEQGVCYETDSSRNSEICKASLRWALGYKLRKSNNSTHVNIDNGKSKISLMNKINKSQPYTNNYRQPKNAKSGRNILSSGRAHQLVV